MKRTMWAGLVAAAMLTVGAVPQLLAAEGDNNSFNLALSPEVTCVPAAAHARVTVSDLGPVQNLHLEVFGLTPNTSFTTFVTSAYTCPFHSSPS